MLKTTDSSVAARLAYAKIDENKLGIDNTSGGIDGSRINDKMANLSSSIEKNELQS